MSNSISNGVLLRKLRIDIGLSAEDTAGLLGVTPRTISFWESETQNMPYERLELLVMKLERRGPAGDIVTVLADDKVSVKDVVSERNFAGYIQWGNGTAIIKSLAIDRTTGRPIVHVTTFSVDGNEHVIRTAEKWQRNLMIGLRSEFEVTPDPAYVAAYEWFVKRIQKAEQRNPRIRELKDQIAEARRALEIASSDGERETRNRELDKAIQVLNQEVNKS